MHHLPPCCASCSELDPQKRTCRSLVRPTLEARQRLLSMPCDVPRLVRLRFRGHGEDVAAQALASWTAPAHDPNTLAWSFGDAPRDARLWLTSWPFRELARAAVQQKLGELRSVEPRRADPTNTAATNPVLLARIASSLARVAQIDPAGFAMLVETLAGEFYVSSWRDAIGAMDAAIAERRLLALYVYVVTFFDAFASVLEDDARAALLARRFTPGDPSDADALTALRTTIDRRTMTLKEMKALYTHAALGTIDALAHPEMMGIAIDPPTRQALARALRIDDGEADLDFAAENLCAVIAWHAGAGGSFGSTDHIDPDRIAALASGALDTPAVAPVARHLFVCADRRCNTLLRWEVGGREAAKKLLAGPISAEPAKSSSVALSHGSPHIVYCRDVLWEAFAKMAKAENRSIDDLVEDAMVRYQSVREIVAPEPPKKARTSSAPPPASRSSAPPPASRSSAPPPVSRSSGPVAVPRSVSSVPPPPQKAAPTTDRPAPMPPSAPPPPNIAPGEPTPMISRVILKDVPLPTEPSRAEMLDRAAEALEAAHAAEPSPPAPATVPVPRPWDGDPVARAPVPPPIPRDIAEQTESLANEADFSEREDTSPKMNFTPLSPPLFVEYAGRRYHVATMRFVIGRERNTCHLVLPDSNVSRQHAIVEWVNGAYYLVDQGSTNGVGSGGHRIHRKQIVEGDRFDICGHAIAFSFRIQ